MTQQTLFGDLPKALKPPAEFQRYWLGQGGGLEIEYACPCCGFEWSGKPRPGERALADDLGESS